MLHYMFSQVFLPFATMLDIISLSPGLSRRAEAGDGGRDEVLWHTGRMKSGNTASGNVFYLPD